MASQIAKERPATDAEFLSRRLEMVEHSIAARGVRDDLVLDAMRKVPRELFLPEFASDDAPLPIAA